MHISSIFKNNEFIPIKYTCDGENINPPIYFNNIPDNTKSIVLIMDDPDVPAAVREDQMFDHWVLFNIAPFTKEIAENESPGRLGANTRGDIKYTGPCPPSQYEPTTHRYFFKAYAIDIVLGLEKGSSKKDVLNAIQGHILNEDTLMGRYSRV